MTDHHLNLSKLKDQLAISNIINTIYLGIFCLIASAAGGSIYYCHTVAQSMLEDARTADGNSYMGGYQFIGGLVGAGSMAIIEAVLGVLLLLCALYIALFLAANIGGYRLSSKFKKQGWNVALVKKVKSNAIVKCIASVLIILPALYFLFSEQWVLGVAMLLPQAAVLGLSIQSIRMMPSKEKQIEADMWSGELEP